VRKSTKMVDAAAIHMIMSPDRDLCVPNHPGHAIETPYAGVICTHHKLKGTRTVRGFEVPGSLTRTTLSLDSGPGEFFSVRKTTPSFDF